MDAFADLALTLARLTGFDAGPPDRSPRRAVEIPLGCGGSDGSCPRRPNRRLSRRAKPGELMRNQIAVFARLISVGMMAACGGTTEPPAPPPPPGLRVVSGDNQSDTIHTIIGQPIILELRGPDRNVAANQTVTLTAEPADRVDCGPLTCDRLYFVKGNEGFRTLTDHTDINGRISVIVNTGEEAGPAALTAEAPTFGYSVVAHVTVTAGAPVGILVQPRDSTAYVGNTYPVGAALVDRFHNRLSKAVSYSSATPAISVDGTGRVRGVSIGRGFVVLQAGAFSDTAWITVPPRGTLAAYDNGPLFGTPTGLVKLELDGSGYRMIAATTPAPFGGGVGPSWAANGREVLFHDGVFGSERLYAVDTLGGSPRLVFPAGPTTSERWGKLSGDKNILYFVGRDLSSACSWLWSSLSDGSAAAPIGGTPDCSVSLSHPSASPNGSEVVVTTDRDGLVLVNPQTGQFTPLGINGPIAEWSPDGSLIAYGGAGINLMNPDGSGRRVLASSDVQGRPSWSPDGAWLLYRVSGRLELANVSTGQVLPLAYGSRLADPVGHPAP